MTARDLLTLFGGAGGGSAVVFCVLFITDMIYSKGAYNQMKADRDDWKRIAELERARADAGVQAGAIVKDVMLGLRKELE